jgi:pimeloyl-ACP methyl ester carboxylesterase
VLAWCDANPVISNDNIVQHLGFLNQANGQIPVAAIPLEPELDLAELMLFSPLTSQLLGPIKALNLLTNMDIWSLDLTPQMSAIVLPTLIIWGANDGNLPLPLAQEAYDSVGPPSVDKEIVVLPNSGHYPGAADYELFQQKIVNFVAAYR